MLRCQHGSSVASANLSHLPIRPCPPTGPLHRPASPALSHLAGAAARGQVCPLEEPGDGIPSPRTGWRPSYSPVAARIAPVGTAGPTADGAALEEPVDSRREDNGSHPRTPARLRAEGPAPDQPGPKRRGRARATMAPSENQQPPPGERCAPGRAGMLPAGPGMQPGPSDTGLRPLANNVQFGSAAEGILDSVRSSTFDVPGRIPGTAGCKPALPRSIGCRVRPRFGAGLSALGPWVKRFLGRCPRLA